MIGFVVTEQTADAVLDGILQAHADNGRAPFWTCGKYRIHSGEHAGSYFLPCDDALLETPLVGNPPRKPTDYPEFSTLIAMLGELEARIDLAPAAIIDPNAES